MHCVSMCISGGERREGVTKNFCASVDLLAVCCCFHSSSFFATSFVDLQSREIITPNYAFFFENILKMGKMAFFKMSENHAKQSRITIFAR